MTRPQPEASYLNDVYLGEGRIQVLPELLEQFDVRQPLVVTDGNLVAEGFVDRLGLDDPVVFDGIETNPTEEMVTQGAETYTDHECDGMVALGGGSPLDVAKGIGIMVHHQPPLSRYAIVNDGIDNITHSVPPTVAVPTTAGSGSEVGRAALLTVRSGRKLGFLSPHLLPSAAICDPELTTSLPPRLTAATGMDALSHCVETYCSPRTNPTADALALDGLERGFTAIRTATEDGDDIDARRAMMLCSLHSGLAFQKGLGAVHSLSHPLGGLDDEELHHGTLNAVFLPGVIEFNAEACPDKYRTMATRLGLEGPASLPAAFADLNRRLGLPTTLQEMGVQPADLAGLAELAVADHCTPTNPREFTEEDAARLYEEALAGTV